MKKTIAIFGARSIALGAYKAIQKLYPDCLVKCFIVTNKKNNPDVLAGLPVVSLSDFSDKEAQVIIATPENLHQEISKSLGEHGCERYISLDSRKESKLMAQYFAACGLFPTLHHYPLGSSKANVCVYMAKFHRDQPLRQSFSIPEWVVPIQVGAALTENRVCEKLDNDGEHISHKNPNYCELTATYYVWKNELAKYKDTDYVGICHYRRVWDISDEDLARISENNIDVILPLPLLHEPDIREHHTRYVKDSDWDAMIRAIRELQPEYFEDFPRIFEQEFMYNYNMVIAKKEVFHDYCSWLFPILERIEEYSVPKGNERNDRYIGYLGENLTTLYFMHNQNRLKIAHTGRLMLT